MRLALDARGGARPHSSYARVLSLLEESARAVDLPCSPWTGGPCEADVLWSPRLLARPAAGLRCVVTLHDVNPLLPDGRPLLLRLRRELRFRRRVLRSLRAAWRVATDSETSAQLIEAHFPGSTACVRVVPLFAGQELRPGSAAPRVLERYGLIPGYTLCVGALRRHKNWENLVRGFARLPAPLRRSHPLVLAGDRRRAGRKPERLRAELLLGDDFRVLGVVPAADLPHLYRGAALFAFPSRLEGFGLPPLEAMASGIPVVASRATCLPEVLGDAPEWFDPGRPAEIAAALERILTQPELAERLRERGLERASAYGPVRTGTAMRRLLGLI